MRHGTGCNQGSKEILGMDSDHEKAPDQNQKKKKHEPGAEQPQLFTDDREDHIVLRFRHKPEFFGMAFLGAGFMTIFLALESYRLERLKIWRHPENYEKGYQTLQGLYAIGSGGLFGRGLGESVQSKTFPQFQVPKQITAFSNSKKNRGTSLPHCRHWYCTESQVLSQAADTMPQEVYSHTFYLLTLKTFLKISISMHSL